MGDVQDAGGRSWKLWCLSQGNSSGASSNPSRSGSLLCFERFLLPLSFQKHPGGHTWIPLYGIYLLHRSDGMPPGMSYTLRTRHPTGLRRSIEVCY